MVKIVENNAPSDKARLLRSTLNNLLGLRVIADYQPEDVTPEELGEITDDTGSSRRYFLEEAL